MEQALWKAEKESEVILMGDLNMRLQEPCEEQEEELATVVAACGLEYMTTYLIPKIRYRGDGRWIFRMIREDWQMIGRRDYIRFTNRQHFFNVGVSEAWMSTYHLIVLAVGGSLRLDTYPNPA